MRVVLEVAGVCVVTFTACVGLLAVVARLGEGDALAPTFLALVGLLAADAVWLWRAGPQRLAPLALGVSLCAVALLQLGMPRAALLTLVLAVAIVTGRLLGRRTAAVA